MLPFSGRIKHTLRGWQWEWNSLWKEVGLLALTWSPKISLSGSAVASCAAWSWPEGEGARVARSSPSLSAGLPCAQSGVSSSLCRVIINVAAGLKHKNTTLTQVTMLKRKLNCEMNLAIFYYTFLIIHECHLWYFHSIKSEFREGWQGCVRGWGKEITCIFTNI